MKDMINKDVLRNIGLSTAALFLASCADRGVAVIPGIDQGASGTPTESATAPGQETPVPNNSEFVSSEKGKYVEMSPERLVELSNSYMTGEVTAYELGMDPKQGVMKNILKTLSSEDKSKKDIVGGFTLDSGLGGDSDFLIVEDQGEYALVRSNEGGMSTLQRLEYEGNVLYGDYRDNDGSFPVTEPKIGEGSFNSWMVFDPNGDVWMFGENDGKLHKVDGGNTIFKNAQPVSAFGIFEQADSLMAENGSYQFDRTDEGQAQISFDNGLVYEWNNGKLVEVIKQEFPQAFLDLKLPAKELEHFKVQSNGDVWDTRGVGSKAYDKESNSYSIKYGNWVLNKDGILVPGEVSTDNLHCVKENISCVQDSNSKIYDGDAYMLDANSTGAFVRVDVRDPVTNELFGIGDGVVFQTENGQTPPVLFQVATTQIPTRNYRGWELYGLNSEAITKEEAQTIVGAERIAEVLPAGLEVELYFMKAYTVRLQEFVRGLNPGSKILGYAYGDKEFLKEQNRVLESLQNGTFDSTDLPYLLNSTTGNANW
jgi:hypothetical protein